ncbi:hypothetical protein V6N11_056916 [Hibiscus sabdariffa]|uniref:RRM domain-containing protein n=1 Tax=Hibiscus sabdariffa TaxID=183260 RepID=A0ABR2T568_9ROSI
MIERLHWKGLWQCFDRNGEVLDVFVPVKRTIDGAHFGFVRMASRADALRAIKRLDGCVLYGSKVRVLFVVRDTRDSFWRRKRGSLPRLSDPPSIGIKGVDIEGAKVECEMGKLRSVEGVVDDEKLVILHTCAIGWVKKVVSISVLAREMAKAVQEAELVRVPAVEERDIDSRSEYGGSVQHGNSVVSPASHES